MQIYADLITKNQWRTSAYLNRAWAAVSQTKKIIISLLIYRLLHYKLCNRIQNLQKDRL